MMTVKDLMNILWDMPEHLPVRLQGEDGLEDLYSVELDEDCVILDYEFIDEEDEDHWGDETEAECNEQGCNCERKQDPRS